MVIEVGACNRQLRPGTWVEVKSKHCGQEMIGPRREKDGVSTAAAIDVKFVRAVGSQGSGQIVRALVGVGGNPCRRGVIACGLCDTRGH